MIIGHHDDHNHRSWSVMIAIPCWEGRVYSLHDFRQWPWAGDQKGINLNENYFFRRKKQIISTGAKRHKLISAEPEMRSTSSVNKFLHNQ